MKSLKHRLFFTLFVLLELLVVTSCSLFNSEIDNIEIFPSPKVLNKLSLIKRWSVNVKNDAGIYSLLSPAGYNHIAYVASRSGQIKAVSVENSKILWQRELASGSLLSRTSPFLSGGVTVDSKYVYIGSEKAVLYVLDRFSGDIIWQQSVAGEVLAKPVIAGEVVLLHTSNGFLQALNSATGAILWQTRLDVPPLSLRGQSMPTVFGDIIVVGDDNGHVNAISLKDGLLIWQQRISEPKGSTEIARLNDVDVSPLVKENAVYASGYNGSVVALDLGSGKPLWSRHIGSVRNLVINDDVIYLVDQDDTIRSLDLNSGRMIWQRDELKNRRLTDLVVYQGYLVVADSEGYLYFLNPKTTDFVYKEKISGDGLLSMPTVVDDQLVLQTRSGIVYAFTLSER